MKGVTFNEQRRTEDRHLLLSSHSHTRARSLFVLAPNKSSFAGQKVSGAEEKMRCAAAGARFYSASRSLSPLRKVKSSLLFSLAGANKFERADQRSWGLRVSAKSRMMLSEVEIAFYRATTTMESAATTSFTCCGWSWEAHACLAHFWPRCLNDVLAAVAFVMEAVNKRLRFTAAPLWKSVCALNIESNQKGYILYNKGLKIREIKMTACQQQNTKIKRVSFKNAKIKIQNLILTENNTNYECI